MSPIYMVRKSDYAPENMPNPAKNAIAYVFALLLVAAAIVVGVVGMRQFTGFLSEPPLAKVTVPGSATVQLDAPGEYMLSYVYKTVVDGVSSEQPGDAPPMRAAVTNLTTKQPVELTDTSEFKIANMNLSAVSAFTFTVENPGQYLVDIQHAKTPPDTQTVMIVGPHIKPAMSTYFSYMAVAAAMGLCGLTVGIKTVIRIKKERQKWVVINGLGSGA